MGTSHHSMGSDTFSPWKFVSAGGRGRRLPGLIGSGRSHTLSGASSIFSLSSKEWSDLIGLGRISKAPGEANFIRTEATAQPSQEPRQVRTKRRNRSAGARPRAPSGLVQMSSLI